jgi:hypothetical protein
VREAATGLAETPAVVLAADLEDLLGRGNSGLEIDLAAMHPNERAQLVARLAAVHMEVDREDLAHARQLLEDRRRDGIDSVVGEIVARNEGPSARRMPR